jgi:hypothetical protein
MCMSRIKKSFFWGVKNFKNSSALSNDVYSKSAELRRISNDLLTDLSSSIMYIITLTINLVSKLTIVYSTLVLCIALRLNSSRRGYDS